MHILESSRSPLAIFTLTLQSSLLFLLSFFSTSAAAADTPTAADDESDTVTVTGSRIVRSDLAATSPVISVDSQEIERSGAVNAEEIVRELPPAVTGLNMGTNLGGPGVETLNLRGLRQARTLTLVDGKRFVPYDSSGTVDVSNIPVSLLERVDVVTGGASAVYGSDAMAGVVNFILKKDFSGLDLRTNFSQTEKGDAETWDLGLTAGGNFADGRGNAVLFVGWTDRGALSAGSRDFAAVPLSTFTGLPVGSSIDTQGTIFCIPSCYFTPGGSANGFVSFTPQGDLAPTGSRAFNYNPYTLLQVPQERVQSTALMRYDVSSNVEMYGRFTFAQTRVKTLIAPSGAFFGSYAIPLLSPYLSQQARDVLADRRNNTTGALGADGDVDPQYDLNGDGDIDANAVTNELFARRMTEVGGRITNNRSLAYQAVAGLQGTLANDWRWDASYQYGRTERSRVFSNDVNDQRLRASLLGCPPGSPTGCVEGNFFGDGNLSAAAADFISLQVNDNIYTDQQVVAASLAGNLGEALRVPGAGPIGAALGVEYRRETSESFPDDCLSTPGCSGGFGPILAVRNRYDVKEIFGELLVPVLEERPFARRLDVETGVRFSDYSTVGNTHAFKFGGGWTPVSDALRLRGMYQKAVRAPNIFEFGGPQQVSRVTASNDPCSGTVTGALRDLCIATGAPASVVDAGSVPNVINGQINGFLGGNPDLEEEDSDTVTAGVVWSPSGALEGLHLQADWYRIDIDNAITSLAANDILSACYSTALNPSTDPASPACALIRRNPTTGGLVGDTAYGVLQNQQNIALLKTEGVDVNLDYRLATAGRGTFNFSLLSTYVMNNERQSSRELPVRDCAGRFGSVCGNPQPKLRISQRTVWTLGNFEAGYRWRFLKSTTFDSAPTPPATPFALQRLDDVHYIDLSFGWRPAEIAGLSIRLGIDNALDKDPPLAGDDAGPFDQNSGNTYSGTFDTLGRSYFVSVNKRF